MNLNEKTKQLIEKHHLKYSADYGQHFLVDEEILDFIVDAGEINNKDIVLEIGCGIGNLTERLVRKAGKVIGIEIDLQFLPLLQMPAKVEIIFGDALKLLKQKRVKDFTKVVANIPYQIGEPLLEYFIFVKDLELMVWTVPQGFAQKIQENPIYSSFFEIKIIKEVPKNSFFPTPGVSSVIITLKPQKEVNIKKNLKVFLCRKLYWQEDKKLKNGLRDLLIDWYKLKSERLSKKKAGEIIKKLNLSSELLEKQIARLTLINYKEIVERVKKLEE